MRNELPLADSLPYAADFMIAVLTESAVAPQRSLSWVEINRLASKWLRPQTDATRTDTSRIGHAVIVEMARNNLLEAELTTAADGAVMAREVVHPLPPVSAPRLAA